MDEALEFGLPHVDERKKILELYLERQVAVVAGLAY
jgi:AAA+ superfamily predicted ATPase